MQNWDAQIDEIIDSSFCPISVIEPSNWGEERVQIKGGRFPGRLKYERTQYFREVVDCLSPFHEANEIAFMGCSQAGKSVTVLEVAIAYYISEHPCKILYLTGHSELSEESMMKLDTAIDNCGISHLIYKQTLRKNNRQTGDTKKYKEFPGGNITSGSATNHNLLRQRDPKLVIADDIDAAKEASDDAGSTVALIRERTGSYGDRKKIIWISTPQLEQTSIIYKLYIAGDQRKYKIPCQCCGAMIFLEWENFEWQAPDGRLVAGSVVYRCQECKDVFDDSNKYEFLSQGHWEPTAIADDPKKVSFYLPSWYKAAGMDNWEQIVRLYLEANPPGQPQDKKLMQVWMNLHKGWPYSDDFEELKASVIEKNRCKYEIDTIPETLSVQHGNGRIVMVTCAADCNGIIDNGRLDYEIVAWAENGASYSVRHGSIGTFVPAVLKRKSDILRDEVKWTYEENKPNCIWDEFEKVMRMKFVVVTPKPNKLRETMNIAITALDTGNTYKNHVYTFIDKMVNRGVFIQGVKGRENLQGAFDPLIDKQIIHKGKETGNLWTLEVGLLKDTLASCMNLNWGVNEEKQPSGFMNFPDSKDGLYQGPNFFSHYESEKRELKANRTKTNALVQWVKKASNSQNHFFDCRVYNMAIKDIYIEILNEKYRSKNVKEITWASFCEVMVSHESYK